MTAEFQAGVYDMDEATYHADPVPGGSLSASGAKKLLACPARFDYDRRHPPEPTAAMELGTAVHKMVLGVGQDIVEIDAPNYRSKAAQNGAKAARAAGKVPLLPHEYEQARLCADAVLEHPIAGSLFLAGQPERSLFWRDEHYGVWRRARLDWLPDAWPDRRMIIPDLKTCTSASPSAISKALANYGYYIQAATYTAAVEALGLAADPALVLVFVETVPPYIVTVGQPDEEAMAVGREAARVACERFRDCTEAGIWPGYADDVIPISLPPWALRDLEYA